MLKLFDVTNDYSLDMGELPSELLPPELRSEVLGHRSDEGELGLRRLLDFADAGSLRGAVIRSLRKREQSEEPDWDDAA